MAVVSEGIPEHLEELRGRLARMRDLTPFTVPEADSLHDFIDESWSRRVGPEGEGWPQEHPNPRRRRSGRPLSESHVVLGHDDSIEVVVGHPAASFQFFGTDGDHAVPGRNPLPFVRVGGGLDFPRAGRAADWVRGHLERLDAYLSGEGRSGR